MKKSTVACLAVVAAMLVVEERAQAQPFNPTVEIKPTIPCPTGGGGQSTSPNPPAVPVAPDVPASLWIWHYLTSAPQSQCTNVMMFPPNMRQTLFREVVTNPLPPYATTLSQVSKTIYGIAGIQPPAPRPGPGGVAPSIIFSWEQKEGDAVMNVENGHLLLTTQSVGKAIRFTTTHAPPTTMPATPPTDYERMTITSEGNVGIGLNTPPTKTWIQGNPTTSGLGSSFGAILEVYDLSADGTNTTYGGIGIGSGPGVDYSIGKKTVKNTATYFQIRAQRQTDLDQALVTVDHNANFGINVTPTARFHVSGGYNVPVKFDGPGFDLSSGGSVLKYFVYQTPGPTDYDYVNLSLPSFHTLKIQEAGGFVFETTDPVTSTTANRMVILPNGNVGIGSAAANPAQKLVVDGIICAKEMRVSLSGSPCWADYVFSDDYKLMPLDELERNIRQNRHLPGIPSAAEVEAEGVHLGQMQAKLLEKIEELTLYVIDLKKENQMLRKENDDVRERLSKIEGE